MMQLVYKIAFGVGDKLPVAGYTISAPVRGSPNPVTPFVAASC